MPRPSKVQPGYTEEELELIRKQLEADGIDLVSFEDSRGNEYGKAMSQRRAKQPATKKYPVEGTGKSISLTQEQMNELLKYGILADRSGNQLILENNKLRIEKRKGMGTAVLENLADAGIDTTGKTPGVTRAKY